MADARFDANISRLDIGLVLLVLYHTARRQRQVTPVT